MPLKRAFRDLAHRQQLTDLVSARVVSFNDHFKVQLKTVTSQIAKAHEVWYDIVTREFDFDDHDFNILVEEILGELVFELVRTDPPIVEIDHQYLNPTPKASFEKWDVQLHPRGQQWPDPHAGANLMAQHKRSLISLNGSRWPI